MVQLLNLGSFKNTIKGDIVTPGDPGYSGAIARWAKNAERNAAVVVFVKDAEDVSKSISYAKEHSLQIAIRGGGHNAAGASSVEGGLVIDLIKYVNHVRIDEEKKLGYVGGGAVWRQVDEEAIKYGLATVGGTVNHTGVGGLTLGGGYGWLSGRHGLTIDNLKQATVVTADGTIRTANENENQDLFWAIRGGGSNFGVVTEFVYQLHPQRATVFAGFAIFSPDKLERLAEVSKKWWEQIKEDEAMIQAVTVGPEGKPMVAIAMFYNASEQEGRANYKEFFDLGPVADLCKEIPYQQLNGIQNANLSHGQCFYLKGISHKGPDYQTMLDVLNKIEESSKSTNGFRTAMLFEYLPLAKVNSVPVDATAFRRGLCSNIMVTISWDGHPEETSDARKLSGELVDIVLRGQSSLSASEKMGYSNYDHDLEVPDAMAPHPSGDHGTTTKSKTAFGPNYPRLQKIKKMYDPDNIFNRWYAITPALD